MKFSGLLLASLLGLAVLSGCASSDVTAKRQAPGSQDIAKPERIIVYDFAGTPADLPPDSAIASFYAQRSQPQTAEEIKIGRELGAQVAAVLVTEILDMGMSAELAGSGPPPQPGNTVIIRGEFVSIDEGSRLKRMLIGFGAGAGELNTLVEGFVVTSTGLRPLGSAEVSAGGGRMPGILVPVLGGAAAGAAGRSAVIAGGMNVAQEMGPESMRAAAKRTAEEIAKVLKDAFRKRGWI